MKKYSLILAAAIGLFSFTACNDTNNNDDSKEIAMETNEEKFDTTRVEDDAEFAVKAADGGMMEVELGKLAASKATSADVKSFANMMVTDHTAANEELKGIAASKNITLPAAISDDKMKKINDLREKTGAEFDKDYMSFMVDDHEDDIDAFKKQAEKGNDAELKQFAAGKVPTLEKHHAEAKRIHDALK